MSIKPRIHWTDAQRLAEFERILKVKGWAAVNAKSKELLGR